MNALNGLNIEKASMVWMITLHEEFVKSFLDGTKSIELRTRVPKALKSGDVIIAAQSGSHNRVVLQMTVESVVKMNPIGMFAMYCRDIQLDYLTFKNYTDGHDWVYGIKVCNVKALKDGLLTSDFGIAKAPQWFTLVYIVSQ